LIGTEGQGWEQVTAELAFERSGPERFLSSIALLHTLIDAVGPQPDALQANAVGRLCARLVVLRQMSLAVTAELAAGGNPAWAASCLKDLGAAFEQEIPELAQQVLDVAPAVEGGSDHAQVLAALMQMALLSRCVGAHAKSCAASLPVVLDCVENTPCANCLNPP